MACWRYDQFTRTYSSLFDSVRGNFGGACDFCARTRFGAAVAAEELGVPIVGGEGRHHSVAALAADGCQILSDASVTGGHLRLTNRFPPRD